MKKCINMKYNHDRDLEDFKQQLDILKERGYNPIGVCQMQFEDVFIFETREEATRGYKELERNEDGKWIGEVVGWWYGKEDFLSEVKKYEEEMSNIYDDEIKVRTHWLNK